MYCKQASPDDEGKHSNKCLAAYKKSIADLDPAHFSEAARHFFMAAHRNKGLPITGEALYRNFQDSRNKMRSLIVPLLPKSFMCMKSGQGFHETCQAVIVKEFRREVVAKKKKTVAEADQMLPPPYWEYRRSPWMFLLCVKIFRKNIHLAPNVTEVLNDVANTVDSRAAVKRKAQNERFKKTGDNNHKVVVIKNEFGGGSSTLVRRGQESATTRAQKHHFWA